MRLIFFAAFSKENRPFTKDTSYDLSKSQQIVYILQLWIHQTNDTLNKGAELLTGMYVFLKL